jgi:hypothetical protein
MQIYLIRHPSGKHTLTAYDSAMLSKENILGAKTGTISKVLFDTYKKSFDNLVSVDALNYRQANFTDYGIGLIGHVYTYSDHTPED